MASEDPKPWAASELHLYVFWLSKTGGVCGRIMKYLFSSFFPLGFCTTPNDIWYESMFCNLLPWHTDEGIGRTTDLLVFLWHHRHGGVWVLCLGASLVAWTWKGFLQVSKCLRVLLHLGASWGGDFIYLYPRSHSTYVAKSPSCCIKSSTNLPAVPSLIWFAQTTHCLKGPW